jgi:hypothetical protein
MQRAKKNFLTRKRPPYFWWLLAHALALCFCILSWILTSYIFHNPDLPKNYAILKKVGQAPLPQAYTALEAPAGDSLSPQDLYREFIALAEPDNSARLRKRNTRLIRSYLQSYKESAKPIYIQGNFRVLQIRPLTQNDILTRGFVIRAQALVQPDKDREPGPYPVVIEYIFPCDHKAAFTWFKPGDLMKIKKNPDCVSVIHIGHIGTEDEPVINLTVVPIAYGDFKIGAGRLMTINAPNDVNLLAEFPLFHSPLPVQ